MKSAPANLAAHLAQEATSLATLWTLTRTDGAVFRFTDHPNDLRVDGVIYVAASGYSASSIESAADLSPDNLEASGMRDGAAFDADSVAAGRWDYAAVEIRRVNWSSPQDGTMLLRKGRLGEIRMDRDRFSAELRGLTQRLAQTIGEVYSPACRADLGDARCGVSLPALTVSGTVTAVTDARQFADSARAEAAGYFVGGLLTWTSGANAGLSMEVKTHATGGALGLHLAMPFAIVPGDAYTLTPGCDKSIATCASKFSNVVNFRGEPYVPGMNQVLKYGGNR